MIGYLTITLISPIVASYFLPEPAHKAIAFPKITPHAPNTKQTPSRRDLSYMDRVGQSIWTFASRLRENDMKYAIKAGMALAMLAAPAFFEVTRPIFVEYRGEWALISVSCIVISCNSNLTSIAVLCRHITNDRSGMLSSHSPRLSANPSTQRPIP